MAWLARYVCPKCGIEVPAASVVGWSEQIGRWQRVVLWQCGGCQSSFSEREPGTAETPHDWRDERLAQIAQKAEG